MSCSYRPGRPSAGRRLPRGDVVSPGKTRRRPERNRGRRRPAAAGLVGELRLSIHPVLVGRGQLLFRDSVTTPLKLVATRTFGTGVVVLS
jgi:hypothetical protein